MKKSLFLCLLFFSFTLFSGCSKETVSESNAEETGTGTQVVETETGTVAETPTSAENTQTADNTIIKTTPATTTKLSVISPNTTGKYTTNQSWNLLKGTASAETVAIEINGFKLTKFVQGSQNWSYIATTSMGTLQEGENEYIIKAFDAENKIIAEITYQILYQKELVLPNVGTSFNLILVLTFIFSLNFFIRRQKA